MSPPMSQACRETSWVPAICFPSGNKSSMLEIIQMKAEGSSMKPTRRAHFPVHMILSPLLSGEYTLTPSVSASQRYGSDVWTRGKRRRCVWRGKLTSVGVHMSNTTGGQSKGRSQICLRTHVPPPHQWDNNKSERRPRTGDKHEEGAGDAVRCTFLPAHHVNIPFLPFMDKDKHKRRLVLQHQLMKSLFAKDRGRYCMLCNNPKKKKSHFICQNFLFALIALQR